MSCYIQDKTLNKELATQHRNHVQAENATLGKQSNKIIHLLTIAIYCIYMLTHRCTMKLGTFWKASLVQWSQNPLPNRVTYYDEHPKISRRELFKKKKAIYHLRDFSIKYINKFGSWSWYKITVTYNFLIIVFTSLIEFTNKMLGLNLHIWINEIFILFEEGKKPLLLQTNKQIRKPMRSYWA